MTPYLGGLGFGKIIGGLGVGIVVTGGGGKSTVGSFGTGLVVGGGGGGKSAVGSFGRGLVVGGGAGGVGAVVGVGVAVGGTGGVDLLGPPGEGCPPEPELPVPLAPPPEEPDEPEPPVPPDPPPEGPPEPVPAPTPAPPPGVSFPSLPSLEVGFLGESCEEPLDPPLVPPPFSLLVPAISAVWTATCSRIWSPKEP